jgi:hypothetical protein
LVPYPPGFDRTVIAQKTAEISRFWDVLGRPRKNKWCPDEDLGVKIDLAAPPVAEGIGKPPRDVRRLSYVWGLDLIRFAAAVMVIFFHLSWKSQNPDIAFAAGWVGVEIFFVLSGFVIMGSASGANVATFARKRFARLYPAAIACAVINLAVLVPFSDLANRHGLAVSAMPSTFIASLVLIKNPFLVARSGRCRSRSDSTF